MRFLFLLFFMTCSVQASNIVNANLGLPFMTVGGDNLCTIRLGDSKIQDAIDTGVAEIRIASNATYTENLLIHDKSVTLRGGFATCSEANSDTQTSNLVGINGINIASNVIRITGSSQRNAVIIENLELTNGSGTPAYPGGGISVLAADVSLTLKNTRIAFNDSTNFGGGIGIVIGNADISLIDSLVDNNEAKTGAGISCIGENNSIVLSGKSGIIANHTTAAGNLTADGKGGGVYLRSGCQIDLRSGTTDVTLNDLRGISSNTAHAEGGGIYAESGAKVYLRGYEYCIEFDCDGDNIDPVNVSENSADFADVGRFNGGGIYATGADTLVFISSGLIYNNMASGDGGGIALMDQAQLVVKRLVKECWDQDRCNLFTGNKSNNIGGAIYNQNSIVDISATYFENNRGISATAIYSTGDTATTRIEGSIFTSNGAFPDSYVVRSGSGTTTEILNSTFADNKSTNAVIRLDSGASDFSLLSSIVDDATVGNVLQGSAGTVSIDCVIAHEIGSISSGNHLLVADPKFVDRANFDYHINANTSPAVDYCNNVSIPQNSDIDNQPFGWDDPNVTNIFGPFDVGADETYENDVIFRNGFE